MRRNNTDFDASTEPFALILEWRNIPALKGETSVSGESNTQALIPGVV